MSIKLSKSIAELEEGKIRTIWEPPDIYDEVHNNDVWLVYGRKGVGKSTIIDFLGTDSPISKVITIRPRQTNLFGKITAIAQSDSEDRIIESNIVAALDFILTAKMIKVIVSFRGAIQPGTARETMYNFMVASGLEKGSVLRKAIRFVSRASGNKLSIVSNLAGVLDEATGDIALDDAKEAFYTYLREEGKSLILCLDDIDEIGFSYSRADRLFINSLIIYMIKANMSFTEQRLPARVLLTSPSELYFQSSLWGGDWVTAKSRCLTWKEPEPLQALVNKRIAIAIQRPKRKPRFPGDEYSVATEHTWKKLFPTGVTNQLGIQEAAFDYIVRHTFYTPRQILDLCDLILVAAEDKGILNKPHSPETNSVWAQIFMETVISFTLSVDRDVRSLFGKIYDNLDDVFNMFRGRPNIWNRQQFMQFIRDNSINILRKYDGKQYTGTELASKLQDIGFVGLGSRKLDSPAGAESYDLRYSFLENVPNRSPWEIAVICPVFYDPYGISPVGRVIVKPHTSLILPNQIVRQLAKYDPIVNAFS